MSKCTLYLLRHAKSDWDTDAATDFERPLASRGRKAAKRIGRWMKKHKIIPQKIVSSPAERAAQTIRRVCKQIDVDQEKITWDRRIYEASATGLLNVITAQADEVKSLMLVGHNPSMEDLLRHLADDSLDDFDREKLVPTACLVKLDLSGTWAEIAPNSTKVKFVIRPRELN